MGRSDFLFVMPSYLHGSARVLDLAALYDSGSYVLSEATAEADARAIAYDWAVIGNDIEQAILEQKQKETVAPQ